MEKTIRYIISGFILISLISFIVTGLIISEDDSIEDLEEEVFFYQSKKQELLSQQNDLNELVLILNQTLILEEQRQKALEQELSSLTGQKTSLDNINQPVSPTPVAVTPPPKVTRAS